MSKTQPEDSRKKVKKEREPGDFAGHGNVYGYWLPRMSTDPDHLGVDPNQHVSRSGKDKR